MPHLGTRQTNGVRHTHPAEQAQNGRLTRDVGMKKLVTASVTFSAGSGNATAGAGTFNAFAVNDPIIVEGTAINNGEYTVLATDASTYLTLDPAPKSAGPVTATIRTP